MFKIEQTVINENNFFQEVSKCNIPVVVEVNADWSGGTHIIQPIIKRIMSKYDQIIKFCKINYDENINIVKKYGITKLPGILIFMNGQLEDVILGTISYSELEKKIKSIIKKSDKKSMN